MTTALLGFTFSFGAEARTCELSNPVFGTDTFKVEVSKMSGELVESSKSILIMPPSGGTNYIDRSYAKQLCKSGFDVYILDQWTDYDEYNLELEIHQRFYQRGQDAIGIVLEQITSPFIGVLGTSVGAEHATIAASRFKKIDSVFIILGGAPISKILVESSQEILVDAHKKRLSLYGFKSANEYEAALDKVFTWEPLKMGNGFSNKDLGMVISTEDTVVPSKYQKTLVDFWNPRTVIKLSNSHLFSVVKTWFCYSGKILEHFNRGAKEKLTAVL